MFQKFFIKENIAKIAKYILSLILMIGFIYPNYKHMFVYLVPTVFNKNEVQVLDKLKHIASREDYVLSWWDYGYPIRYYADVKTLIDGGKHSGAVNFPVSFALTRDLLASRNMAVLDVYQTEYNYNHHINDQDYLKFMMKRYDFKDPNDFLEYLDTDIKLPKLKENIYYYLPLRMFNILPVVAEFSTLDLKTGKKEPHFYYYSSNFVPKGNILDLGNGVRIDLSKALVLIGNNVLPIKKLAITEYNKEGKLHKVIKNLRQEGLDVIFMKDYKKWLVVDDFYFNSAYIQLFVFENTGGLFEPVIKTPFVKVYKVKK
jgi:dolichyl-diphosphooligosaccharide--protein glycosyltransferase/undecaprenyl-diphosphooligosaccharide--protein glycosyltransferase